MSIKYTGLILLICLSACNGPEDYTTYNNRLAGQYSAKERPLRKMRQSISQNSTLSGSAFFLFGFGGGNITGQSKSEPTVTFAYLDDDGSYRILTLPFDCIRIRLKQTKDPTIRILVKWQTGMQGFTEYDIKDCVIGVEIQCREEDWPIDVELPMDR